MSPSSLKCLKVLKLCPNNALDPGIEPYTLQSSKMYQGLRALSEDIGPCWWKSLKAPIYPNGLEGVVHYASISGSGIFSGLSPETSMGSMPGFRVPRPYFIWKHWRVWGSVPWSGTFLRQCPEILMYFKGISKLESFQVGQYRTGFQLSDRLNSGSIKTIFWMLDLDIAVSPSHIWVTGIPNVDNKFATVPHFSNKINPAMWHWAYYGHNLDLAQYVFENMSESVQSVQTHLAPILVLQIMNLRMWNCVPGLRMFLGKSFNTLMQTKGLEHVGFHPGFQNILRTEFWDLHAVLRAGRCGFHPRVQTTFETESWDPDAF